MRVTVDRELCIGAGQCVRAAPSVFGQNIEDGRVELRSAPDVDGAAVDDVVVAVDLCPARVLAITATEGPRASEGGTG